LIFIDRDAVSVPNILVGEKSAGQKERARAEKFFADLRDGDQIIATAKKTTFKFQVYSRPEVKEALQALFHGKCAYCESRYAGTQPMDVEHFRPKSEATELDGSKTKPGYYWLASEWSNMLPSCIDCNRTRKQIDAETGEEVMVGKGTMFPVAQGTDRVTWGGDVRGEQALLLNPCEDYPEQFLAFVEGVATCRDRVPGEGMIEGADEPVLQRERAEASIHIYGLNRSGLVEERRALLLRIRQKAYVIRTLTSLLEEYFPAEPDSEEDENRGVVLMIENLIAREVEDLLRMKDDCEPYAQMARQEIESIEREIGL